VLLQIVEDLVIEEAEDRSRSRLFIFDSLESRSLAMPHRIETMEYQLVDPVVIRFHIGNGLHEIIRDMMQLQLLHVE